jgi:hypothetical protein
MKKLIGLFVLFYFTSCDPVYEYTYEVTNSANAEISIYLKRNHYSTLEDKVEVFFIGRNETKIVLTSTHGVEPPDGPFFDDVTHDLDSFEVVKNTTEISNRDYLDNSSWSYENGQYSTTVTNDEFD